MVLNNPAGNDVNPLQPENVPPNIELVSVADDVLMALNKSAGSDVNPVQPENVWLNI